MKKIISFILVLTLSAFCSLTAFAQSDRTLPLVVDNADILSDSEETTLTQALENFGNAHKCEIAVVTVTSVEGKSHGAYAEDFYDYNGYGYGSNNDGVLFLVDMGAGEMYITAHGTAETAVNDYAREKLLDKIEGDVRNEDYFDAFMEYAEIVDDYYTQYENGTPYDSSSGIFEITFFNFLVAIVVAVIAAFVGTGTMKSKLKSVHSKPAASDYVKAGSLNINQSNDIFLYRNVSRVRVESNSGGGSSSHRSSSGRSHTGGGRSFR